MFLRNLILIFFITGFLSCNNDSEKISLKAKLINSNNEKVYLQKIDDKSIHKVDSAIVDDKGDLLFEIERPKSFEFYMININNNPLTVIVDSSSKTIEYKINALKPLRNYTVNGSEESDKFRQILQQKYRVIEMADSVYGIYRKAKKEEVDYISQRSDSLIRTYYKAFYDNLKNTIRDDKSKAYTILALYLKMQNNFVLDIEYDYELFKDVSMSLSKTFPENIHVKSLENTVEAFEKQKQTEAEVEKNLSANNKFPDIEAVNPKNELKSLYEIKANKKIVIFWETKSLDSWNYIDELFKIKSEHNNFEVFAVSMDTDKLHWSKMVKLKKLDWINVIGSYDLYSKFNLKEFPKVFLLDSNNVIVYKNPDTKTIKNELK